MRHLLTTKEFNKEELLELIQLQAMIDRPVAVSSHRIITA